MLLTLTPVSSNPIGAAVDAVARRYRYHDPVIGRFTSFDSFEAAPGDPMALHKYAYGNGDPVNNTDPSGLFSLGELNISNFVSASIQGLRAGGLSVARAYALKTIQNASFGAVLGAAFGGAIAASDPDGDVADGILTGAQWGAIFGAVPAPLWRTPFGRVLLGYFAVDAATRGVGSFMDGNITQGLLYFAGAGLSARAAFPSATPSTLYAYVPKNMTRSLGGGVRNVNASTIATEGLKPGVEGKVWATSMSPAEFRAWRIGGSWGADIINRFPFLRAFSKNFEEGSVVRINNTSRFTPSNTHWKNLLGQYEADGPIAPGDIQVVPFQ